MLHSRHGVCRNDEECFVCDGVVGTFGFGLGIFGVVYVLGDSLTLNMVPLRLVLECEDIKDMDSLRRQLGVGEHFPRSDEGLICLGRI